MDKSEDSNIITYNYSIEYSMIDLPFSEEESFKYINNSTLDSNFDQNNDCLEFGKVFDIDSNKNTEDTNKSTKIKLTETDVVGHPKRKFFEIKKENRIFHSKNLNNSISEKKTKSKRSKKKQKRKYNSDNIRRKIKSRFHKSLKNTLNKMLKYSGSNYFFDYLPQSFITNVTKARNKKILNMTFEDFFSQDFCEFADNDTEKNSEKWTAGKNVITKIEQEDENIREKSNYNVYKKMKYYQIYNEYLRSKEFEEDIIKIEKKEGKEYTKQYINLAYHLIDYFSSD